ncbi:hypothetical protein G7K_5276-t1 [Saitoella complicata NRRL Y-17804]|uniref:Uncharacterized protein n=1 Tax=Saitoella complicata (strain BCRC 22490 / CBS 7301 / JCM 7358 / NBRC 10748 / NRRL Y-17804) TaxID=698492 RepID=A0A0E9NP09_SAICN|nr:hypothetical protein G7K_5276-t1 [Saitoella complicata NRRL Y-17804]
MGNNFNCDRYRTRGTHGLGITIYTDILASSATVKSNTPLLFSSSEQPFSRGRDQLFLIHILRPRHRAAAAQKRIAS